MTTESAGGVGSAEGQAQAPSELEELIVEAIRMVYDPEIPVNIYDLGLIYDLRVDPGEGSAAVKMTLTTPGCPVAGEMPGMVERAALTVEGIDHCDVELVWEPAWNPDMMSEEARLTLNI